MCGCKSVPKAKTILNKSIPYTGPCTQSLNYYENLLDTVNTLVFTTKVGQLKSYLKSQINIYDRDCTMFESQIATLKLELGL